MSFTGERIQKGDSRLSTNALFKTLWLFIEASKWDKSQISEEIDTASIRTNFRSNFIYKMLLKKVDSLKPNVRL